MALETPRWVPLATWIALGVVFFGSLRWAAMESPKAYDWRHTVISSLASPRDNPRAYGIACAGLAISGMLLLPFIGWLDRRLRVLSPGATAWAGKFLGVSAIFLTLSALVVPGRYRILGLSRTHEHLAQISSVAFCLALLLYLAPIFRLPTSRRWLRPLMMVLVILPVTALCVSRLFLFFSYEFLSNPVYRTIRGSLWNSLALWEWIGALCLYLFLGLVTLALPERTEASNAEATAPRQNRSS